MGMMKVVALALVLVNLISTPAYSAGKPQVMPANCKRIECPIECPTYDVIYQGNGYEIRTFKSAVWMSTASISDTSFVQATRTGFKQLLAYIKGNNEQKTKIDMTAPVMTQVSPGDGPLCESSYVVNFNVPKVHQANPPLAKGLQAQTWESMYVAVRQFDGFVSDDNVGQQAAALHASLAGTKWAAAVDKGSKSGYMVAQYNSPMEFQNRVNEIWMKFDIKDVPH